MRFKVYTIDQRYFTDIQHNYNYILWGCTIFLYTFRSKKSSSIIQAPKCKTRKIRSITAIDLDVKYNFYSLGLAGEIHSSQKAQLRQLCPRHAWVLLPDGGHPCVELITRIQHALRERATSAWVVNFPSSLCMYVHMYVCMDACVHVCMYICLYICKYVRMYVCVCMYVCTPTRQLSSLVILDPVPWLLGPMIVFVGLTVIMLTGISRVLAATWVTWHNHGKGQGT